MLPKTGRWRSDKYIRWIKQQGCIFPGCDEPAREPHHLIGLGGLSGMGLTAADSYAMPICRRHHDEIHRTPELWPEQWEWCCRTLARAMEQGVITINRGTK